MSFIFQVVDIALKMTALHAQYADAIIRLARQSTVDGWPINRPVWWLDPSDPVAQTIDSGKYRHVFYLCASIMDEMDAECHLSADWDLGRRQRVSGGVRRLLHPPFCLDHTKEEILVQ